MNKTKIEWVKNPDGSQGWTWNPITGCLNGCSYCYARRLANGRLRQRYLANANVADITQWLRSANSSLWDRVTTDPFYPRFWPERLGDIPLKPSRGIFVCDMSDLFGIGIPEDWTERVLNIINGNPQHRFYLLTKQPQNLIKFSPFPDNCWVGVTATDRHFANQAQKYMLKVEAKIKYLSIEPCFDSIPWELLLGYNWVIIGAQTKPYKPPEIEWIEEIVQACDKAGVPVFIKNNLYPLLGLGDGKSICHNNEVGTLKQEMPK